jgi:hypothetical protein
MSKWAAFLLALALLAPHLLAGVGVDLLAPPSNEFVGP